jgi:hypothetical protein
VVSARSFRREREREARKDERRRLLQSRKAVAAGALIGVTALLAPAAAAADTFTVDKTTDPAGSDNCDPGTPNDCSLRQAVDHANANSGPDIVSFSGLSGTIRLTQGQINVSEDVDFQGPGADTLTISGDADNDGAHDLAYYGTGHGGKTPTSGDSRIFQFGTNGTAGSGVTATISGLTLSGATSGVTTKYTSIPTPHDKYFGNDGGAIIAYNSSLSLSHVKASDNQASANGGVVASSLTNTGTGSSSLTVNDSDLSGNEAYAGGGAVSASNGTTLSVNRSTVSGNQTDGKDFKYNGATGKGGGILGSGVVSATITDSTIDQNDAADAATSSPNAAGGGVYLTQSSASSTAQITGSSLSGNTAIEAGGGAYIDVGHITIDTSTVDGNGVTEGVTASGTFGGGLAVKGDATVTGSTVSSNQVSANTASQGRGGGLFWAGPSDNQGLAVGESTISGNQSSGAGGGVYLQPHSTYNAPNTYFSGPVTFKNTTIASNTAGSGGGGGIVDAPNAASGHPTPANTLSSTIVATNSPDDLAVTADSGGFQAGNSLIQSDVSGIPFTQSPAGSDVLGVNPQLGPLKDNGGPTDTRLPAGGSPALDVGVANAFSTDQRGPGFSRTVDDPSVPNQAGDGTDIGAVERPLAAQTGATPGPVTPVKKCKKKKRHGHKSASAAKKHCKKKRKKKT